MPAKFKLLCIIFDTIKTYKNELFQTGLNNKQCIKKIVLKLSTSEYLPAISM